MKLTVSKNNLGAKFWTKVQVSKKRRLTFHSINISPPETMPGGVVYRASTTQIQILLRRLFVAHFEFGFPVFGS